MHNFGKNILVLIIIFFFTGSGQAQTTLRIATYNLLNFNGNISASRILAFITVIRAIDPDILAVQELSNSAGYDKFYHQVMLQVHNDYCRTPYMDGYKTDNGLFYRKSNIILIDTDSIDIGIRPMSRYDLLVFNQEFTVYIVHLKSSKKNKYKRRNQAKIIRRYLNNRNADDSFILVGDLNVYSNNEPAFKFLTGNQQNNNGRLIDPLNKSGVWYNSKQFANIHTQSTRSKQFGGGAHGGLDDRFDFILISNALAICRDIYYQEGSYKAFGNDGKHFNQAVNNGRNYSVSERIVEALHSASDHLPVYADFYFNKPP